MSTDAIKGKDGIWSTIETTSEGVVVALRLTPKAGRTVIEAPRPDAHGVSRLRVAVTAPPADNLANEALVALLAKAWKIPKSAMTIIAGARGREKKVLIRGDAKALLARIGGFTGEEHG